jgi:ribonuclease HII
MIKLNSRYKDDSESIIEIGFDEAGRGCFFGPIMASAVVWPPEIEWTDEIKYLSERIRDSKKLSPKRRNEYAESIRKIIKTCGVGMVSAEEINERGIQWANREAFRRALRQIWDGEDGNNSRIGLSSLAENKQIRLMVDGEISFCQSDDIELNVPWTEEILIIEGDGTLLSIAAASILAKVAHDTWIENWIKENSEIAERYDMTGSKGYGTLKHREGLGRWGAIVGHRTLFIRKWIPFSDKSDIAEQKKSDASYFKKKLDTSNGDFNTCLIRI